MRYFLLLAALLIAGTAWADSTDSFELRKLQAIQSAQKHKPEAESALKTLLRERPTDTALLFQLGIFLGDRGRQLEPGKTRKAIMREARKYFIEAGKLGFKDPLITTALAAIKEDGSESTDHLSDNPEIDGILHEAEEAYAHHQFDRAIERYQAALKIQPTNYFATLNLGDAYFSSERFAEAVTWFKKAVVLNPNRETAYRYCGDALLRQGRKDDALDQFLSAIIAEPYNGYPWRGLQSGLKVFLLKPWQAAQEVPTATITDGSRGPEIHLTDNTNALQLGYAAARVEWQGKYRAARFPQETPYRWTLEEEVYALNSLLKIYAELKSVKQPPELAQAFTDATESMDELAEISAAGLLEAHVLFFRANKDIAADYAGYRDKNRDKLRSYLIKYYLHIP